MNGQAKGGSWIIRVSAIFALLTLLGAMAVSLYLLVDPHNRAQQEDELQALHRQLDDVNRRIEQLQQPVQPSDKAAAAAFERDLKQHELLLTELRSERGQAEDRIKYASDLLKEVKETEDRTRSAAASFLGIFGALAALLLGQNYWQFRGWKEAADQSLEEIKGVQPDIDIIRATRRTLENRLPKYIQDVQHDLVELKLSAGPAVAKMHEIDHLAYLSNTEMRFKEKRTADEATQYLLSLLEAARGHVFQKTYYGAGYRLQEFFHIMQQHPDAVTSSDKAKAHSTRAFVYYKLLAQISSAPSWIRDLRSGEADQLRQLAFAELKKAQECDGNWARSYFVEALLYSRQYVPERVKGQQKDDMFLEGQRKAILIYQGLITRGAATLETGVWQNLACCLKRVADISGQKSDYESFKTELNKFPTDQQVRQASVESGRPETEEVFVWQSTLQDEELFGKVDKINRDDYRSFWEGLLDNKVKLRKWRDDLAEIKKTAGSKMTGWVL
jgi:hypothetical protein